MHLITETANLFFFFFAGISQIMLEAQRSVGWYNDESDSGFHGNRGKQASRGLKFRVL